ncbi:hypothetical protein [Sphingomonas sp. Leaf412]|uniref:hypothetical protein n=1 Tax=Sphingomonas sp. Leaf412 TaxID=1736370 RepID=UPI000A42AEE4|nr:hypothetical protein [Sphingomonas sp. Leaf412]
MSSRSTSHRIPGASVAGNTAAKVDRPAAVAAAPFAAWLCFAALLAERIRRDSPGEGT